MRLRPIMLILGASSVALAVAVFWRARNREVTREDALVNATTAVPARAAGAPAPALAPSPVSTDEQGIEEARRSVDVDPRRGLQKLEEDARQFPSSPHADERSYLRMRALVNLEQIPAARAEAESFFERFPQSPWAPRAFELTGVHPRPPLGPRR